MTKIEIEVSLLAEVLGQDVPTFLATLADKDADGNPLDLTPEAAASKIPEVLKAEKQRFLAEGQRMGARTRMNEFEAKLREKYGVEGRTEGEALVDAIVGRYEQKAAKALEDLELAKKAKPTDKMTEDEIKTLIANHEFFQASLNEERKKATEIAEQFNQYKQAEEKRRVTDQIGAQALEVLKSYNPVETDDDTINSNLRRTYQMAVLNGADFRQTENGIEVLDKATGEPLKDQNFRIISFGQYVEGVARQFYKQHAADPRKAAPNGGGGGGNAGVQIPDWSKMTQDEIFQRVLDEKDPAKRQVLLESAGQHLK